MANRIPVAAVVVAALVGVQASAASVTVDFPSSTSQTPLGDLGVGGDGEFFVAGDFLTQTFSTSLSSATSATWNFTMYNFTQGADSTFDVRINGVTVGTYTLFGCPGYCASTDSFSFSQTFAPIAGPDYTLSLVATSTVATGDGSWNWFPGGSVTLSGGAVPEPASWAMMIAGFGLVGGAMRRRSAAVEA